MLSFQYSAEIIQAYPDLSGGVILARGVKNGPTPDALLERFKAEQTSIIAKVGQSPLSEIEALKSWRQVFRSFGVIPTKYRSAPEAILRRLTKQGSMPSINTLVDIGNLISIRYSLPVAVFDTRAIKGQVKVHFADGTERFTPLFQQNVEHPVPGEVVFSDETGLVIARRWCWRQADYSAARENTEEVIITVEAHHRDGRADVEEAISDLIDLMKEFSEGEHKTAILGTQQSLISF